MHWNVVIRQLLTSFLSETRTKSGKSSEEASQRKKNQKSKFTFSGQPQPSCAFLCGGEHSTSAAHVAKGALAGAVGAAATDTWDTGNSTPGTPGLGAGLVTCNHN